jgi:hypothetical protein
VEIEKYGGIENYPYIASVALVTITGIHHKIGRDNHKGNSAYTCEGQKSNDN